MSLQSFFTGLANPFMKAILRSSLYGLAGKGVMLISVTGKRSKKVYSTPVNYRREADRLTIVSLRERTWWRNVRGGAQVTVYLQGKPQGGRATVLEDPRSVAEALSRFLLHTPQMARYLQVRFSSDGKPLADDLDRLAASRVVVEVTLR